MLASGVGKSLRNWTMRTKAFWLTLLLLPVFGGLTAPARAQETIAVDLDGATVQLVIPTGYCFLDSTNPIDKAVLDFYQENRAKSSRILAFFQECDGLAQLRAEGIGEVIILPDYGYYIVGLKDQEIAVYPELTRTAYAREFAAALGAIDSDTVAAEMEKRLDDIDTLENSSVEFQQIGVTDHDDDAAYLLIVADTRLRGRSQLITGSGAMTLVQDRAIGLMFSRFYDDPTAIDAVQRDAKALLRDFLAANPD